MAGVLFNAILTGAFILAWKFSTIVNVYFTSSSFEATISTVTSEIIYEIDTTAMFTWLFSAFIDVNFTILPRIARRTGTRVMGDAVEIYHYY